MSASTTRGAKVAADACWNRIGVRGDGSCPELSKHVHCRNCPVFSTAASELLDAVVSPAELAERARRFALPRTGEERGIRSALVFRVGDERLALATTTLEEVLPLRPIHSLPHRRGGAVLGVANVRGELIVGVSLAVLLGIETGIGPAGRRSTRRLLVAALERDRAVFPVDEVLGIHRFHPRELLEVPATVARATATYSRAMLLWQETSVGLLDDELLFHTLNRSLA